MKKFFIIVGLLSASAQLYSSYDQEALRVHYCRKDLLHHTHWFLENKKQGKASGMRDSAHSLIATLEHCPGDVPQQARGALHYGLSLLKQGSSYAVYLDAIQALAERPIILAIEASRYAAKESEQS